LAASTLPSTTPTLPSTTPTPSATPVPTCERPTLIGTIIANQVAARTKPDLKAPVIATFDKENALGTQHVFDLVGEVNVGGRTWFKALLPIRPNGTTGYLSGKALKVTLTTYRLSVDRDKFRLTLYNGCKKIRGFPVGIGTGSTPTPVGKFYLTGLFKPPSTTSVYGVSIYTLSGFSEVLTNWELGGIIGLHGTNDPSSIGRYSSHGCIRMRNRDILALEKLLPLGTPIVIQ
jgi:lipoprotein-anchoring transpeptidase ErfK/SrfK